MRSGSRQNDQTESSSLRGGLGSYCGSRTQCDRPPIQIRKEFHGQAGTPDYVIFSAVVRAMSIRNETDRDFALSIVQDNMKIGSRQSAEDFLTRMLDASAELANSKEKLDKEVLCTDAVDRSNSDIYRSMDMLDDLKLTLDKRAYSGFEKTLNTDEKKYFSAWLNDEKGGYKYASLDHSSLYEGRGIDVKIHLQQVCIELAQR